MIVVGIVLGVLYFIAAAGVSSLTAPAFFVLDIQAPFMLLALLWFNGVPACLLVFFVAVLAGESQGYVLPVLLLSTAAFGGLTLGKNVFMLRSPLFVATFTALFLAVKSALFFVLTYKAAVMPRYLVGQIVFYILGNTLLAPLLFESADRLFRNSRRWYEKNIHHA